ncbi:MAG: hypothetical protein ABR607_07000 [Pyrinomonadaceae bacterium]
MIGRTLHRWLKVTARRNRGLGFLLLACIVLGSTAEFAHHHGSQPGAARQTRSSAGRANASRIESTSDWGGSSTRTTQNDCLICQLHHNLSASDINHSHGVAPALTQLQTSRTSATPKQFGFALNTQGRAPPVNL